MKYDAVKRPRQTAISFLRISVSVLQNAEWVLYSVCGKGLISVLSMQKISISNLWQLETVLRWKMVWKTLADLS